MSDLKLYISTKKDSKKDSEKCKRRGIKKVLYGMTLYSDKGLEYSTVQESSCSSLRFMDNLLAIKWALEKFSFLVENKKLLSASKGVDVFIDNKIIYRWFEKMDTPFEYKDIFSDIILDISFLDSAVEVIYGGKTNKVLLKKVKTSDNVSFKTSDLLTAFNSACEREDNQDSFGNKIGIGVNIIESEL